MQRTTTDHRHPVLSRTCQAADRLRPTAGDQDHVNSRSPAAPCGSSNKTACSTKRAGELYSCVLVLGERQVGGEQHPARCAETTGQISEGLRLTSTLSRLLDPSFPGLAPRPQRSRGPERLLWRTNSLPLLSGFMGAPQRPLRGAPEERWASWQGQTGQEPRAKTSKYRGCCQSSQDRGEWGEESLILSFLSARLLQSLGSFS